MKVASIFSGIGGFEKGILQAEPTTEIVFSSEIDKYARTIYNKNFGVEPHGDITKIKATDVPDHDILCGGFPCQAFSIAGKRRGFEDTRGTLFFEIMRIAKTKRPKLLFFENVRGLLSHDQGRTFQTILRSMDDMGYNAEWQVLNSKNHGVPQNRERVFIIGHLRGSGTRQVFPITENGGLSENENTTVYCLDANYYKEPAKQSRTMIQQLNNPTHSNNRVYNPNGISPSINCAEGGNRQPFIKVHSLFPRNSQSGRSGTGHLQKSDESTYCLDTGNSMTIEIKRAPLKFLGRNQRHFDDGDYAFTVDSCNTGGIEFVQSRWVYDEEVGDFVDETSSIIRRLTPKECERLQGFPDGWTEGISDTQRYKCLGNAVTVNVIEFIFRHIVKMMHDPESHLRA